MKPFKVSLVSIDLASNNPGLPQWVERKITAEGIDFVSCQCGDRESLIQTAGDADVVWVYGGGTIVTADALPYLTCCKALLRSGAGTDNMPVQEATRAGILVVNTPKATEDTVADHAVALLLSILRCIPKQDRAIRQGIWDTEHAWPDWTISGSTLGLVGFGRIARNVARKLRGFDLNVIAADPYVDADRMAGHGVRKVTLDEILTDSDFISVHVPLTDETHHLISDREFQTMKPKCIVINTARGPIVDEMALIRALTDRQITAAGLDVLESEPIAPDSPLKQLDNVVMTPHSAANSDRMWTDFWRYSVEAVIDMAQGRLPASFVNPDVASRGPFKAR